MRLKYLIAILIICCSLLSKAQLYDAQWVLGCNPTTIMDFRNDTLKLDTLPGATPSFLTVANICDEAGNLLYYTNGIYIEDKNGDTLQNGTGINPCPYTDSWSNFGLNIPQAALFIPKPGNCRYYYLFHFSNDTLGMSRPGNLYYSLIDKDANGGLGSVVSKNNPVLKNVILRGGGMTACKHANGRDYWLIMGASDTNMFYKFLITPDSILGPYTQNIGNSFLLPYDVAYNKFSQDGSKFVATTYNALVLVLDFDRCNGLFSNPQTIYNETSTNPAQQSFTGAAGAEFSANGNFLYLTNSVNLNQFDLTASNIQDSVELYRADTSDNAQMRFLQLAPNGKIYCSTWNGGYFYLHEINYPDQLGTACGFVRAGQPTLSLSSFNLPNLINYRLGPLIGSGCDTITTGLTAQTANDPLRVQPNPANKYAYVEMGMQGNYIFHLLDATGKLISQKQTPQIDIFDTEQLPNGIYFISVKDSHSNTELANRRVVVAH